MSHNMRSELTNNDFTRTGLRSPLTSRCGHITRTKPLADLGVTRSHSRPHVSNDNPYSEAQFKTLKYRPAFPARFASVEAARAHCQDFFRWYNNEHRHGGPGLHTAADVHHGHAAAVQAGRAQVLDAACAARPERFVSKPPAPPELPGTSWINPPQQKEEPPQ
jgi:putative transposase